MPYRETPRTGKCLYCKRETSVACVACAHLVCPDCQATHDEQFEHRSYSG